MTVQIWRIFITDKQPVMKKLLILSTFALLFSAAGFAGKGGDQDKGKDKKKKTDSTKTMTKPCPGKECSKKKGSWLLPQG